MLSLALALNEFDFLLGQAVQPIDDLVDEGVGQTEAFFERRGIEGGTDCPL